MLRPMELYELILDNIYNGVLITDAQGYVIYMNRPYGEFLGLDPQAQVGKHCTEVLEFSRMHIVAQTGRAELNQAQWINGQNMVVQRIPIRKDDQVVAVYGQVMFKNAREVGDLAARLSLLQSKVEMYKQELIHLRATRYTFDSIVGITPAILDLKRTARRAAQGDAAVLISGESGTGKELIAKAIHYRSGRAGQPFVSINCGALPENLLESELFGHVKGSFTGAIRDKDGMFKVASGGTFFLDEVGETTLAIQVKLLRVLQEREIIPVGGTAPIKVDVRLIAATNSDLEKAVKEERFRADLYYRLNVIPVLIPPLRDRRDDIPLLVDHFLRLAGDRTGRRKSISKVSMDLLCAYDWPGNVRELENVIERAVILQEGDEITPENLPVKVCNHLSERRRVVMDEAQMTLDELEKEYLVSVLEETGWQKKKASAILGINASTLYRKIQRYGLSQERLKDR